MHQPGIPQGMDQRTSWEGKDRNDFASVAEGPKDKSEREKNRKRNSKVLKIRRKHLKRLEITRVCLRQN